MCFACFCGGLCQPQLCVHFIFTIYPTSEYIFILFLLIWHYIHYYYYIFYVCVLSMCTQTILSKQKTRNQTTTKKKYTRTFTLRRDEKCVKQCSRQANFRRSVNTRIHTHTLTPHVITMCGYCPVVLIDIFRQI